MLHREDILDRWRNKLFSICVLLAVIGTVCEIVIYLVDASQGELFLPNRLYRMRFIYIPSCVNLTIILITHFCLKSKKLSSAAKNTWSCILIFFLCANMQILHYVYGPLATLPIIAILISSMYANRLLTLSLTIASTITLSINAAFACFELRANDQWLPAEIALALTIIWVSYIASRLLTAFVGEQIDAVLNSRQRENELMEELNLDDMLGIGNRKALETHLSELSANQISKKDFCLMILDIDHFKKINDSYGHSCGDKVLLELAKILRNHSSERVLAYRYGGDEIVILLKDFTKAQCTDFANVLLREFQSTRFSFMEETSFSFSAGIAGFKEGMSDEAWINTADGLLYQAKKEGRGRIIID